jgi:hypothetical protein
LYVRTLPVAKDTKHLTAEQLAAIGLKAAEINGYFHRLQQRMEQTGFPVDDELYQLVCQAHDKTHHLRIALHYLWCDKTRGR